MLALIAWLVPNVALSNFSITEAVLNFLYQTLPYLYLLSAVKIHPFSFFPCSSLNLYYIVLLYLPWITMYSAFANFGKSRLCLNEQFYPFSIPIYVYNKIIGNYIPI